MKKILTLFTALLVLAGCTSPSTNQKAADAKKELKTVKVASHTPPMTDMLEMVKEDLNTMGYQLEIVRVSDNVQPNVALENKEVDANFFQHAAFMQVFNEANNGHLVAVQPVYDAIVSFYGKEYKSKDDIKDGAVVGIPSDNTNIARALRLLAENGLITLKDPTSFKVTQADIIENPKNLQFKTVGLLNLNEAYNEVDMVFNYPAYIAKIGLNPTDNGLLFEKADARSYAIQLVAREDNKDSEEIKALKKVLTSEKIKNFIEEKLKGHAVVAFK